MDGDAGTDVTVPTQEAQPRPCNRLTRLGGAVAAPISAPMVAMWLL
jgi:hypothetical protein